MSAASLGRLRARTQDAIVDLAAIRSTDPAARHAIDAVRLTLHTLQGFWLPALDRPGPEDAAA